MYKQIANSNVIVRLSDMACIPYDENNSDRQQYDLWLLEGNRPLPPDPIVVPKPTVVSMRQARLALLEVGLLDQIEAFVSTNRAYQIEWEYAAFVERTHPLIGALGLSEETLDELFELAASK